MLSELILGRPLVSRQYSQHNFFIFNVQHNQHIYLPAIATQYIFTELSVKKLIQGGGDSSKHVHGC